MFICRVRGSARLRAILEREFPGHAADLWRRVEQGRPFHTVHWHQALHVVWKAWKAGGLEACPLLNPFRRQAEDVDWVDGGDRRPHVRAKKGKGRPGTAKDSDALARHQWVQTQLVDLGLLLDQGGVFKEWDVDPDRADVVWEKAALAWEVDLSPPPRAAQENREAVRARHGLKMIALVDAKKREKAHLGVPTLVVGNLYGTAERASNSPRPLDALDLAFQSLSVRNAWALGDVESQRPWIQRDDVTVRSFCEQYLAGQLEYRRTGVHRWYGLRGWIASGANDVAVQWRSRGSTKEQAVPALAPPLLRASGPAPHRRESQRPPAAEPPIRTTSAVASPADSAPVAAATAPPPGATIHETRLDAQSSSASQAEIGWRLSAKLGHGLLAFVFVLLLGFMWPQGQATDRVPSAPVVSPERTVPVPTARTPKHPRKQKSRAATRPAQLRSDRGPKLPDNQPAP